MQVVDGTTPERLPAARALFEEYAASLAFDLAFQDFERELAGLPGDYAPPRGRLLLALVGGDAAGCAGLRPFDEPTAELKRMYVRPAHRGSGLGRRLAGAAIAAAREIGYERIVLDTVPGMETAQQLYDSLGFARVPPYRFNPVAGAAFMELRLR